MIKKGKLNKNESRIDYFRFNRYIDIQNDIFY